MLKPLSPHIYIYIYIYMPTIFTLSTLEIDRWTYMTCMLHIRLYTLVKSPTVCLVTKLKRLLTIYCEKNACISPIRERESRAVTDRYEANIYDRPMFFLNARAQIHIAAYVLGLCSTMIKCLYALTKFSPSVAASLTTAVSMKMRQKKNENRYWNRPTHHYYGYVTLAWPRSPAFDERQKSGKQSPISW